MNLTEIVHLAQKGNTEAFSEIYTLYFDKIFRFIYFKVNHKETAEDICEEVFLKAFSGIQKLKNAQLLTAWLYQIARNLVIDHYRRDKIHIDLTEVENLLEYQDPTSINIDNFQSQTQLLQHLKTLTLEQQQVIMWKFFEGLDNTTIAVLLGKNEGAIRTIQHRALSKLKDIYNEKLT